jgi:hypothetical protein
VLIERNVTRDSGTSAIEAYNADDVRIQYNETFGTKQKAGGADSNASTPIARRPPPSSSTTTFTTTATAS